MHGTKIKIKVVEKEIPQTKALANGAQRGFLPPTPKAIGNIPNTVVTVVRTIGRNRIRDALIMGK